MGGGFPGNAETWLPTCLKRTYVQLATGVRPEAVHTDDGAEIINSSRINLLLQSEMIRIFTALPKSWSVARICEEFGVTIYTARLAKRIVQDKGVMSSPNSKAGKPLSQVTSLTVSS